MLIPSKCARPN